MTFCGRGRHARNSTAQMFENILGNGKAAAGRVVSRHDPRHENAVPECCAMIRVIIELVQCSAIDTAGIDVDSESIRNIFSKGRAAAGWVLSRRDPGHKNAAPECCAMITVLVELMQFSAVDTAWIDLGCESIGNILGNGRAAAGWVVSRRDPSHKSAVP